MKRQVWKQPKISGDWSYLDVKNGRGALAKRVDAGEKFQVFMTGTLQAVASRDDGTSIEFEVGLDEVKLYPLFVKGDEVKAGDRLVTDGGFTCLPDGSVKNVFADPTREGLAALYVKCKCGQHFLDGQLDHTGANAGRLVGLRPYRPAAKET